ncbi:MAG: hypothetical protein JNK05_33205 [Myxococcales bacterium]|nr:hypothetical protein [Myxococcales bacterium]
MTATRSKRPRRERSDVETAVAALLEGHPTELRERFAAARRAVRSVVPTVTERVRRGWGLLGFDAPKYFAYVSINGGIVRLGFEYGAMLADPHGHLRGEGTQVRWVEVSHETLMKPSLEALIEQAWELSLRR